MWSYGLDRGGSRWGQMVGSGECGNESSVPYNAGTFVTVCKPVSYSRRTLLHTVSNLLVAKNILTGSLSVESRGRSALHN